MTTVMQKRLSKLEEKTLRAVGPLRHGIDLEVDVLSSFTPSPDIQRYLDATELAKANGCESSSINEDPNVAAVGREICDNAWRRRLSFEASFPEGERCILGNEPYGDIDLIWSVLPSEVRELMEFAESAAQAGAGKVYEYPGYSALYKSIVRNARERQTAALANSGQESKYAA
jgi:hypothetical protein